MRERAVGRAQPPGCRERGELVAPLVGGGLDRGDELAPGRVDLGPEAERPLQVGAVSLREFDERHRQRVCGKPRSIVDVAGSGQREVTTLPRV